MIRFDTTFPHEYAVEEISRLPGKGKLDLPVHYIPPPISRPEHDGFWLKMVPLKGNPWIGVFAFGDHRAGSTSRVISSPHPRRPCILSGGAAYLVDADKATGWERVAVTPVLDVRIIEPSRLLVFSDFTRLTAYGENGLVWRTPRLCWDELKIERITQELIEGTGFDPTSPKRLSFAVELKTGRSMLEAPRSTDGRFLW